MSEPKQTPPQDVANMNKERLFFLVLVVVLASVAVFFFLRSRFSTSDVEARNVELEKQVANINEKLSEIKTAEIYRKDQQQTQKSRLQQAADRAKLVSTAIAALQEQTDAWQKSMAGLLTTDSGKRLATSVALLQQFSALQKQSRPSSDLPAHLRSRLDIICVPIEAALHTENSAYAPSDDLLTQLNSIENEAAQATGIYTDHNRQLQAILAQVPASAPAAAANLQEALDAQEKAWADQRNQRIRTEVEKIRREGDEEVARQQADNERRIAAAAAERNRQAAEKHAAELAIEAQKEKDAAAALALKKQQEEKDASLERQYQADLPDIQAHLKAMFVAGYSQPIPGNMHRTGNEKRPLSLNAIRTAGCLQEGINGRSALFHSVELDPDRRKAGWPEFTTNNTTFFIEAQNYLIKYGDLLVNKRLLDP